VNATVARVRFQALLCDVEKVVENAARSYPQVSATSINIDVDSLAEGPIG
jgi:hypothetical protein